MDRIQNKRGVLQKVGESLYRYSSNRVYYARIKKDGKEIKRSLGTTDPALARRNHAALKDELRQIDRSGGRITLEELTDRYLTTTQHQKPKTVERKTPSKGCSTAIGARFHRRAHQAACGNLPGDPTDNLC
jgi:hypothetical protein